MKAEVYSKEHCPNCIEAIALLKNVYKADITIYKIDGKDAEEGIIPISKEQLFEKVPDAKSVPQIFIDDEYVGGFSELKNYLAIERD